MAALRAIARQRYTIAVLGVGVVSLGGVRRAARGAVQAVRAMPPDLL
jgi:hypothetical protein